MKTNKSCTDLGVPGGWGSHIPGLTLREGGQYYVPAAFMPRRYPCYLFLLELSPGPYGRGSRTRDLPVCSGMPKPTASTGAKFLGKLTADLLVNKFVAFYRTQNQFPRSLRHAFRSYPEPPKCTIYFHNTLMRIHLNIMLSFIIRSPLYFPFRITD